jgi:hypothetical protein
VLEIALLLCVNDELVNKAACSVAAEDVEAVVCRDILETTGQGMTCQLFRGIPVVPSVSAYRLVLSPRSRGT